MSCSRNYGHRFPFLSRERGLHLKCLILASRPPHTDISISISCWSCRIHRCWCVWVITIRGCRWRNLGITVIIRVWWSLIWAIQRGAIHVLLVFAILGSESGSRSWCITDTGTSAPASLNKICQPVFPKLKLTNGLHVVCKAHKVSWWRNNSQTRWTLGHIWYLEGDTTDVEEASPSGWQRARPCKTRGYS